MPVKKKRGRGKTGPLSDKEMAKKAAKAERRALMEEEKRRKRKELISAFLKMKLQREQQNSRLNLSKVNLNWRNILRDIKVQEMRNGVEVLWHRFDRAVDRKNALIDNMVQNLEEADEQYNRCQRSHMENIDRLIDIYQLRLTRMKNEYEKFHDILREEYMRERAKIDKKQDLFENKLADIMYAVEVNYNSWEIDSKGDFQSRKDQVVNQKLEDRQALKMMLETSIEDMWLKFQNTLKNYQENTESTRKKYQELRAKDEKSSADIAQHMMRIHKLNESIASNRSKLADMTDKSLMRMQRLRMQRDNLRGAFKALRVYSNHQREEQKSQLTFLSRCASQSLERLEKAVGLGEWILKSAEICRKWQTEEEKVIPFLPTVLLNEEEDMITSSEIFEFSAEEEGIPIMEVLSEYKSMTKFWQRYNKAVLDVAGLKKELDKLTTYNNDLKNLMKHYLTSLSVPESLTDTENTLVVVNNKTPPIVFGRQKRSIHPNKHYPTVIEATANVIRNLLP